ncbi:MAG: hypothetical protein R3A80_12140 [Bdellovibrionota bacterium]
MNKLLFLALFVSVLGFSESNSTSSESSSEEATGMGGVSVEDQLPTKPSKLKGRIKGNFKGKDPMIAPDGQSQLPPTDGSRPKSK